MNEVVIFLVLTIFMMGLEKQPMTVQHHSNNQINFRSGNESN